ncbi:hypothetical protein JJB99_01820 [Bradyrhizobium diazoefficiens]|uniref:hypothetical protein n=1 Tax=Bradyrhizobium diazoefficiens TaxID=1355477 RepID=UPI00190D089B|nr:hypothetical protein [Bradyrhizobium diazoefficiens]QQO14956.1 hypothetical protein JJB99_01820 [Bradyrhizobium diazoefficiens]
MAKSKTGSRFNLGEPYSGLLRDFCEANYGAPETRIIREAIKFFIEHQLAAEPRLKARFDEAREKRLAAQAAPVRMVSGN